MSSLNEHTERWRTHQQPRRVDYSRPGFVRPADPECEACGVLLDADRRCWWCDDDNPPEAPDAA